jgi:hypothetical protein
LLFAPVLPMSLIAVNLLTNSAFCNCARQLSTKIILVLSSWQNQEVSKDAPSISSYGGGFYIITSTEALCELTLSKRDLQLADVGTAPRGYPQLQSMGAIVHGET